MSENKQERPEVSDAQIEKSVSASKPADLPVPAHNIEFADEEKVERERLANQSNSNEDIVEPSVTSSDAPHVFSAATTEQMEEQPDPQYIYGAAARQRAVLYLRENDADRIVVDIEGMDLDMVTGLKEACDGDDTQLTWELVEDLLDPTALDLLLKHVRS